MCTHEIWTYSECGCRYDHHISCFDVLANINDDSPEPRPTRNSSKSGESRLQADSSPVKFPPSPSPTDSENEAQLQKGRQLPQRSCSINRTVHKTFLEPICHDCLLAELAGRRDNPNSDNMGGPNIQDGNMIWDSDVKIEVDDSSMPTSEPQRQRGEASHEGTILGSNVEVRSSDVSRQKSLTLPNFSQRPETTLSAGDADSESSTPSIATRGRPRSRSQLLRRMAMDVSREDLRLRISSRLSTFQQEGLQSSKDELQRDGPETSHTAQDSDQISPTKRCTPRPLKSFMQRLTDAHNQKWLKAKDAVNDLSRKMSRKSPSPIRMPRTRSPVHFGYQEHARDGSLNELKKEIVVYNRAVDASINSTPERPSTGSSIAPENFYLQANDPFHPTIRPPTDYTPRLHTLPQTPIETWRFHLEHDLTTPRQRKHRHVLCSPLIDGPTAILDDTAKPLLDMPDRIRPSGSTSTTAVSTSTTSQNWQSHPSLSSNPFSRKSYEYTTNSDEAEARRRLLSLSRALSGPATSTSESYSIASVQQHRLASLVSDGDFDQPDDQDLSVGMQNIEREMAMVGLTENPWRGHSLSSTSEMAEVDENNRKRHVPSVELPVALENPFRDNTPATPPPSRLAESASPLTAVQSSTSKSTKAIPYDLSTLSGLPNASYLSPYTPQISDLPLHNSATPYSPSPTPSPATPFNDTNATHRQLALHALSTPFHHSLAPNQHNSPNHSHSHDIGPVHLLTAHYQRTTPQNNAIAALLQGKPPFSTKSTRPQSAPAPISLPSSSAQNHSVPPAPAPEAEAGHKQQSAGTERRTNIGGYKTITHIDPRITPPEAPSDFSLGVKSPVGLFSCVWVRNKCPGLPEAGDTVDDGSGEEGEREKQVKCWEGMVGGCVGSDADGANSEEGLLEGNRAVVIKEAAHKSESLGVRRGETQDNSETNEARQGERTLKSTISTNTAPQHNCGRPTTWQVRSCICSGRVRTASSLTTAANTAGSNPTTAPQQVSRHSPSSLEGDYHDAHDAHASSSSSSPFHSPSKHNTDSAAKSNAANVEAEPKPNHGSGLEGLEIQCHSTTPIVRYKLGSALCASCAEKERRGVAS